MIPKPIFEFFQPMYHWLLALGAAVWYGFPSRRLTVIGVTGTNGKSTVVAMLHFIFQQANVPVASLSSIRFKINDSEELNTLKMTMPGRFRLQKFLCDAVRAGCRYAILEVTSEGIKQHRHIGIRFAAAVLTNVTPEHIESHGSFEKYRATKARIFHSAPIHVLNGEDKNIDYFSKIPAVKRAVYTKNDLSSDIHPRLIGDFNYENMAAAYATARVLGITHEAIKKAIEIFPGVPGRLEFIQREPFSVVVDYAHTPDALQKVYQTIRANLGAKYPLRDLVPKPKLICVLGATGGGRDKWKRPEMGKIAAEFCDSIFLTNEDPYDENPLTILKDIESGISQIQSSKRKILNEPEGSKPKTNNYKLSTINYKLILDRREAIRAAISQARPSDIVIITGKGSEPWMMGPDGAKIPWSDKKIVQEELLKTQAKLEL